jgi:hypothetical protein
MQIFSCSLTVKTIIIILNLHSGTKLSGWLRHCTCVHVRVRVRVCARVCVCFPKNVGERKFKKKKVQIFFPY